MKPFFTLCCWLAVLASAPAQSGPVFVSPGGQVVISGTEKFGGIGAAVNLDSSTRAIYVAGILPGHGAAKSGLLPNDLIVEVDGVPTLGRELQDVIGLIRGPVGSSVEVVVTRDPQAPPLRFWIVREEIKPSP
jgi:C-terminal processing protease CtpA/Prc